jgi:hypothetical protein
MSPGQNLDDRAGLAMRPGAQDEGVVDEFHGP